MMEERRLSRMLEGGLRVGAAKKIAARQNRKAYMDNILAVVEMFFKGRVLGLLSQDPRPLWEKFRKASNATDEAYVAFVVADETGASWEVLDALWDNYQALGTVMFDALDEYNEEMRR